MDVAERDAFERGQVPGCGITVAGGSGVEVEGKLLGEAEWGVHVCVCVCVGGTRGSERIRVWLELFTNFSATFAHFRV